MERRISVLESQVESLSAVETQISITETSLEETTVNTEDNEEVLAQKNLYSLENMSAKEIYAECVMIFDTISHSQGKTIDEYYESFCVKPYDEVFPDFYFNPYSVETDNIEAIECKGLSVQMDNTVGNENNGDSGLWIWMTIRLKIYDYDKAKELYDLMASTYPISNSHEEGSCWTTYTLNPQGEFCFLSMRNNGSSYSIEFTNVIV